jgi:hypothetical protein
MPARGNGWISRNSPQCWRQRCFDVGKHTNLHCLPIHLSLDRLLQRQQRNVHRILELQTLRVPLLEKSLRAGSTLPDRCSLPGKITPTRINLVQTRSTLENSTSFTTGLLPLRIRLPHLRLLGLGLDSIIPASDQQTHAIGSHAPGLSGLLHDSRHVLDEYPRGRIFVVYSLVACVGDFAGFVHEDAVVGSHAGVDHADVGGDEGDFGEGGWVDQR